MINTNFVHKFFIYQLLLRHVSASVPGHLQEAVCFLHVCSLRFNLFGSILHNIIKINIYFFVLITILIININLY
jgi:hypothetical protein